MSNFERELMRAASERVEREGNRISENSFEIKEELSNTVDYLSVFIERAAELKVNDVDAIIKHLLDVVDVISEMGEGEEE